MSVDKSKQIIQIPDRAKKQRHQPIVSVRNRFDKEPAKASHHTNSSFTFLKLFYIFHHIFKPSHDLH